MKQADPEQIRADLERLALPQDARPDASIVVPVNAQGDLENVLRLLEDLVRYRGVHRVEFILVVNNFPEDAPPPEIEALRSLGARVLAIPNTRIPGEAPGFSARVPGARAARANAVLLFDADCRVPNSTALFDWYIQELHAGCGAAYTPVHHYDYDRHWTILLGIGVHHLVRWGKRVLLRIPTTRGSNYAVARDVFLDLYEKGALADEMNVGPTFKANGHKVAYSGRGKLAVLTSGRRFVPGLGEMVRYNLYRLRYNRRVLPVGSDVASRTGRERDAVRRYVDNRPVS